ncbi:hypothetical protein, partial [Klebsiella pneumoniae]|uniref:hypothetical protein n=1 Tax=Klebsiella pneumoniae TaxID=573 RepID=UPI001C7273FA
FRRYGEALALTRNLRRRVKREIRERSTGGRDALLGARPWRGQAIFDNFPGKNGSEREIE